MQRRHLYTKREIVVHYLNLSTNRFAEDPMFKMVMYDYLATSRVKNNVFVRVGQDPETALSANAITPEQLRTAMHNRVNKRTCAEQGRVFVQESESKDAAKVLKSVKASSSKMWGSNEEREVY